MGQPVDRSEDARKYEQRGEGEGGESPTEARTSTLQPLNKKKRKSRKRYFTVRLFPITGILALSTLPVTIVQLVPGAPKFLFSHLSSLFGEGKPP